MERHKPGTVKQVEPRDVTLSPPRWTFGVKGGLSGDIAEPLWHVPAQSRLPGSGGSKRSGRQEPTGKDSPNRHSKVSHPSGSEAPESLTEALEAMG